jgi:cytochrome c oxidase cbb3-type subunit 1
MAIYWTGLTWAGIREGMMMNNPDVPFLEVVRYTVPYLWSRTAAGILLSVGHVVFAVHFAQVFTRRAEGLVGPPLFGRRRRRLLPAAEVEP